ncbi:hypothetical protein [Ruegeria atlantica]|uniref:hypothetical protein n=1 Tax=Ruegeria atlantica TaxID=81569 RepID=UPI001480FDC8|nr:hypothetical protein [Ruegeria atlantica]
MKQFKYRDVPFWERARAGEKLAKLGKEGWEKVGVARAEFGIVCFFKRELTDG